MREATEIDDDHRHRYRRTGGRRDRIDAACRVPRTSDSAERGLRPSRRLGAQPKSPGMAQLDSLLASTPVEPSSPQISVIIPCLNEEDAVGKVVDQAFEGIRRAGRAGEVLVVDNGSTDARRRSRQSTERRVVASRGADTAVRTSRDSTPHRATTSSWATPTTRTR